MTSEHRFIVGLQDVKTLGYQCKCGAKIVFPIGSEIGPSDACHSCRTPWKPQQNQQSAAWFRGDETSSFVSLLRAITTIRALEKEGVLGFRLVFEFDQDSVSDRA